MTMEICFRVKEEECARERTSDGAGVKCVALHVKGVEEECARERTSDGAGVGPHRLSICHALGGCFCEGVFDVSRSAMGT